MGATHKMPLTAELRMVQYIAGMLSAICKLPDIKVLIESN